MLLAAASISTQKTPEATRGSTSRCRKSTSCRSGGSRSLRGSNAEISAPLGSVQRSSANTAAVTGISSSTSTRTTISSAYCVRP